MISVSANIVPNMITDLHNSWFLGDTTKAMKIDLELMELNKVLFLESNPCPVKYAASSLGICNYELRLPLSKINDENKKTIDKVLKNLKISFS